MSGLQEEHSKWLILNSVDGNQASVLRRGGNREESSQRTHHPSSALSSLQGASKAVSFQYMSSTQTNKYGEMTTQRSKVTCLKPNSLWAEPFKPHCTHLPPLCCLWETCGCLPVSLRKPLVSRDFLGWGMLLVHLDSHSREATRQFECRTKDMWNNQAVP